VGAAVAEKSGLVSRKRGGGHYARFRNRIVFPNFDLSGEVVAVGGRVMDSGEPKYLNTAETPIFEKRRVLYNLHAARGAIRKEGAVVVEGYMDVVSLAEAGFPSAVATLGTAMGEDHVRLLRRFTDDVTLVFDGDEAGRRAMVEGLRALRRLRHDAQGGAPARRQGPRRRGQGGIEVFMGLLAGARDIWELMFDESFPATIRLNCEVRTPS
jgi:DNA primase